MRITDAVRAELESIRQSNGGLLLAKSVLTKARDKTSALHSQFDWNVARNAERGLLLQAQELIMQVRISVPTTDDNKITVRAYWSLASDRLSGGGYRPLADVMSNEAWREELLATALSELGALRKRYERLEELTAVFAAVTQVRARAQRKQSVRTAKPRRDRSRRDASRADQT